MLYNFTRRALLPGQASLDRRSGQALVLGTLTLTILFGAAGLAVDLGWDYFLKQRVQTAADSAATAAAIYALNNADICGTNVTCPTTLSCTGVTPPATATSSVQAGCLYANADGPPVMSASIIENHGAPLPPGLNSSGVGIWFKATVNASSPNEFLSVFGVTTASISASAVAAVTTPPPAGCIYALDPTAPGALTVKGTASISATNCPVFINSSNPGALLKTGSGNISGTIDMVGGVSQSGSGTISPAPSTGHTAVADPMSALPAPPFNPVCDALHTNWSTSSGGILWPGVYCGGISITGSTTVTMNPGLYVMNGGGFSSGGSAGINATNITIYNTAAAGQTIGSVSITGSGNYVMSAPIAGTYEGVLIFQQHNQSIAGTVTGSASSNVTGTLYFPNANLTYTGTTSAQFTAIVADTVTMVGTSAFKTDSIGTYTGLTIAKAVLLQ